MQLLVSVASAAEASAAVAGGADVIDAKDPLAGALGAVTPEVLRDIHLAVGGARPVSAALGDGCDEATIERHARAFTAEGVAFLKIGFAGISTGSRVAALIGAAVRGAKAESDGTGGVVAVAYADANRASSLAASALVSVAAFAGAKGLLLDTIDKNGPGLRELVEPATLAAWVAAAHEAGLLVALAGRLTADDLSFVRDTGADIAGVRGAACDGGRTGRIVADRVRLLKASCATSGEHVSVLKP
jgi:uncharacterized protein (UPF0264 family)